MPRHRLALTTATAVAALALTACSGDAEPGIAPSSGQGVPDSVAVEAVKAAGRQSTGGGSSKFVLTSTTAIGGRDVTFAGQGAFDHAADKGQLSFAVPGADGSSDGGGRIEERIIGPDLYLTLPLQPGTFYKLKIADVVGTSLGASTDPTAALSALQGVVEVRKVGQGQVRGATATHYEGTYDVQAAIAAATGANQALLRATLGAASPDKIPFDAYLDGEDRLVRFEQELALPATSRTGGQALTSRTVLELFDFGTVVDVVAPPPASVRDGAPLLAALRRPSPQGGASPSAAPSKAAPSPSLSTAPAR